MPAEIAALRARHAAIADALLAPESARLYLASFDRDCHDIEGILHTVKLTRAAGRNVSDLIVGYGELWSTKLFSRFFEARGKRKGAVQWVDARQCWWWSGARWALPCNGRSRKRRPMP